MLNRSNRKLDVQVYVPTLSSIDISGSELSLVYNEQEPVYSRQPMHKKLKSLLKESGRNVCLARCKGFIAVLWTCQKYNSHLLKVTDLQTN